MVLVLLVFTDSVIGQEKSRSPKQNGQDTVVLLTDQGTVELHVANLPLSAVLRLLSLKGKKNIIASPNVKGSVTANLYDVSFEEALNAILVPNDAAYRQLGNFIYIYTTDELKTIDAAARGDPITHVFMLNYISGVFHPSAFRRGETAEVGLGRTDEVLPPVRATHFISYNTTVRKSLQYHHQDEFFLLKITESPLDMRYILFQIHDPPMFVECRPVEPKLLAAK